LKKCKFRGKLIEICRGPQVEDDRPSMTTQKEFVFLKTLHGCYSLHTSCSWWIAHAKQRQWRLQQHPLLFTMNCTDRTFFLWRLHLARPSHPSNSIFLMRLESSSGKRTSFTLRQQATIEFTCHNHSITACSHHVYMGVILCTHHILFVVNRTFNAMPTERLQHYLGVEIGILQCTLKSFCYTRFFLKVF